MSETRPDALPVAIGTARDYAVLAAKRLDPVAWQYLQEGSGQGLTLSANRRAFESQPLMPRPLRDVRGGHTRVHLFGQALAHPIMLAPIAYQRLFHPEGERASAMAAAAQGGAFWVSSLASQTLESIAMASRETDGDGTDMTWFQLYWQGERARTLRLARRAESAGYAVMMLTVDAPVKLATLRLPDAVQAVNLERPMTVDPTPQGSRVFDGWMSQAPTWDDVAWLRDQIGVPLILKGILHPDDAKRAIDIGCDGIVVSNHGGRVLDGAPSSLEVLPSVVAQVAGRVPVLLDSGIRDGREVFKALQAGASAVLLGRPYIWGLASAGALGVAHVIRLMRDELELTMALCGCRTLPDITSAEMA